MRQSNSLVFKKNQDGTIGTKMMALKPQLRNKKRNEVWGSSEQMGLMKPPISRSAKPKSREGIGSLSQPDIHKNFRFPTVGMGIQSIKKDQNL